ncbi:5-formyltetrahydrofolate cyclo-ligase [Dactylosporangium sucinum]|uniref:5-formyltetrahydrofolate cyclo-ligase n=1 Tax=Dactylosporangium sucinum TaxID=1424081 RepID=A0A917X180_9ACTN|nr:5-formyltetrahydrofolate cyclo-ligase [Dactylosporangium sucinum]GGM51658.1 5-formyltetrahydrofolate cyclo-ligase [Dactylosporangium sucinum]
MSDRAIDREKDAVRQRVWDALRAEGAAPPDVHGHIPSFFGADEAASRLVALDAWREAAVVKANPDTAQLPVRIAALHDGKLLYMAVPKLATVAPFYLLDPTRLTAPADVIATSSGAAARAERIGLAQMQPVDLIVCGSVAVNRAGVRVGKGAGYSDIEVALLAQAGLIGPQTTIITTVHELQVVGEGLPETEHDFSVDLIVTPRRTIACGPSRRPAGIIREHLTDAKIADIPVLMQYATREH